MINSEKWYKTKNILTDQKGFVLIIPLDIFENGYHILKIDKIYWSVNKNEMKLLKNWNLIPFELENAAL